jgi:TonB family protein
MRIPFLIFFFLCSTLAYSQDPKVKVSFCTVKGDSTSRETAAYYVVDSTWNDESSSSYSFYLNSEKPRTVERRGKKNEPKYKESYYESGGIQFKGLFYYSIPVGSISFNYENGMPMGEVEFSMDYTSADAITSYIIQEYSDSSGNKLVDKGNGSGYIDFRAFKRPNAMQQSIITPGTGAVLSGRKHGVWKGPTDKGSYEEIYETGKLIKGAQEINGKTYAYTKIEVQPEFVGGLQGMSNFVSRNIVYPKPARRRGIEGNVFTEFIVDKDGRVTHIKTIKGISAECDAEAARMISIMPKWTPGLLRGVPVDVRFVLPVKFKLR